MAIDALRFRPYGGAAGDVEALAVVSPRHFKLTFSGIVAACVVAGMLLFVTVGPLLWSQDPSRQWLSQISLGPTAATSAVLVADQGRWQPGEGAEQPTIVAANTEYVRLHWPARAGVPAFLVYRNRADVAGFGLPLATVSATHYEDVLQLREVEYRYSIVDAVSGELLHSLNVRPVAAISVFEAQLQGLLTLHETASLPDTIQLPAHPLGTDALGRDMLARLMAGGRTSLFVGIVAPLIFISAGCLYGAVAGMAGGWLDQLAMRFVDFVVALPFLLFMILLRVAFGIGPGEDGVVPLILALVVMSWTGSARLIRGQVMSLRRQSYIEAARLAGLGNGQIILRHILPNIAPIVLVCFSFAVPQAIFTEAFLSFIGMGVAPPSTSWGALCNDGLKTLLSYPSQMLLPALCISITVLAFNILGDALRDAGDSRMGERG